MLIRGGGQLIIFSIEWALIRGGTYSKIYGMDMESISFKFLKKAYKMAMNLTLK